MRKVCSAGMLQEQDWESLLWAISAKWTMTSHEIYCISLNRSWMASRGKQRNFSMTDSRSFVAQGQQSRQLCPVRFCSSDQLRPLLSALSTPAEEESPDDWLTVQRERVDTLLFEGLVGRFYVLVYFLRGICQESRKKSFARGVKGLKRESFGHLHTKSAHSSLSNPVWP